MNQQEFYGEIELVNNKRFEGKFTINELGEYKHRGSGYIFKEDYILLKREFKKVEKQFCGKRNIKEYAIHLWFFICILLMALLSVIYEFRTLPEVSPFLIVPIFILILWFKFYKLFVLVIEWFEIIMIILMIIGFIAGIVFLIDLNLDFIRKLSKRI